MAARGSLCSELFRHSGKGLLAEAGAEDVIESLQEPREGLIGQFAP